MGSTKLLCAPAHHQHRCVRLRPAFPFALQHQPMNAHLDLRRQIEHSASSASLAALSSRAEAFVGVRRHRTRARCRQPACVVEHHRVRVAPQARRSLARGTSLFGQSNEWSNDPGPSVRASRAGGHQVMVPWTWRMGLRGVVSGKVVSGNLASTFHSASSRPSCVALTQGSTFQKRQGSRARALWFERPHGGPYPSSARGEHPSDRPLQALEREGEV